MATLPGSTQAESPRENLSSSFPPRRGIAIGNKVRQPAFLRSHPLHRVLLWNKPSARSRKLRYGKEAATHCRALGF
jgi:hypothetical protein